MSRYDIWMRRIHVGGLDAWGELFVDLSSTGAFADWKGWAIQRVPGVDDEQIQFGMTRGLLEEVIYAAGGVERELIRLEAATADAQRIANDWMAKFEWDGVSKRPGIVVPEMLDASYAYINVIAWARNVRERVQRKWKPREKEQVGLLPTLAAGPLRDAIAKALATLDNALDGYRELANYALHSGAVPGGGTPRAEVRADGTIAVKVPDPPTGRVPTWEAFTFDKGHDQLSQARHIMDAVERFVDAVLTAWEVNLPARLRP